MNSLPVEFISLLGDQHL